jgi:CheY-like chemotaxis protein
MKTILIANDDADLVKIIQLRLRKAGYETVTAATGQEAVDMAKQHRPAAIVMDYHMPVFSGAEACKRIKNDSELTQIPILLLTASLNVSQIQTVNADDYIEIVDLIEKIKKWTR